MKEKIGSDTMIKNSNSNKRYYTLDYYYKKRYKSKVFKVTLDLGLSCPNIDGTKGYGGCIYCKNGSKSKLNKDKKPLKEQFNEVKKVLHKKWKNAKYIAYFQNNTNTYGDLNYLKKSFEEVLTYKDVVGINIATRPDAITNECLEYLKELNKKTDLTIELGLQTIHEKTSKLINRGHTLKEFEDMYKKLKQESIKVVVHIINGLPYETTEMMLETVKYLNNLKIDGIKIHMLHILKDTKIEKMYKENPFHILTKEEYIDIVTTQLENLNENIVINRITGDPIKEDLVEPVWLTKKFTILNDIDKELKKRNTYQGYNLSILNKARTLMETNLKEKDIVIDATIGNGKDSLFLLNIIKKGILFGFDIQQSAIDNTNNLLKETYQNYKLFNTSHENMFKILKEYKSKISLIVFNLGFLPKGDKNITTNYKSTIKAIKNGLYLLNNKGHIVITIYPGHEEGKKESIEIEKFLKNNNNLSYKKYYNTDNEIAPYVIDIKLKKCRN